MDEIRKYTKIIDNDTKNIFSKIIPKDNLYNKRLKNIDLAHYKITFFKNNDLAGIVFIRYIFFIPNITWITSKKYLRQGIAKKLIENAKIDNFFFTAYCRNKSSKNLALKCNLYKIFNNFFIWIKF